MSSLQTPPLRAVIFDHDGTLVDSEPVHLRLWRETLAEFGSGIEAPEYQRELAGIPSIESARYLVRTRQLPVAAELLYERKRQRVDAFNEASAYPLMAGASELVRSLAAAGIALAVASGARGPEVRRSLQYHGIDQYFAAVCTADDVARNKPAPEVYQAALRALAVAPHEALAVEDTDTGERAARGAELRCWRLATFSRLTPDVGTQRVKDLREVAARLNSLGLMADFEAHFSSDSERFA